MRSKYLSLLNIFNKKSSIKEFVQSNFNQYNLTFDHKNLTNNDISELKSLAYFKFYFNFKKIIGPSNLFFEKPSNLSDADHNSICWIKKKESSFDIFEKNCPKEKIMVSTIPGFIKQPPTDYRYSY